MLKRVLAVVSLITPLLFGLWRREGFGTNDFIEYWSAYSLARAGQNPYDPALMLPIQQGLGWHDTTPLMMWNPPWTLLFLLPAVSLAFTTGAAAWLVLNLLLLGGVALLTHSGMGGRAESRTAALLGALSFVPVWLSLELGQLGVVLAFFVALLYWGIQRERYWVIGGALAGLTVKPHLFLLLVVGVVWWMLRFRSLREFASLMGGGMSVLGGLVAGVVALSPTVIPQWLEARRVFTLGGEGAINLMQWRVATVVDPLRELFFALALPGLAYGVSVLVPLIAAILTVLWLNKYHRTPEWTLLLPPLLGASFFFAPFGWIFDFSPLVVVQIFMIVRACDTPLKRVGNEALLLIGGAQMLTAVFALFLATEHQQLFWFPVLMVGVWWVVQRALKTREFADE